MPLGQSRRTVHAPSLSTAALLRWFLAKPFRLIALGEDDRHSIEELAHHIIPQARHGVQLRTSSRDFGSSFHFDHRPAMMIMPVSVIAMAPGCFSFDRRCQFLHS